MGINYWGMVHGTQAFLPHLTASRGQLANVSSVFGLIAFPGQSACNASKFVIRGFTEALRMELSSSSVAQAVPGPANGSAVWRIALVEKSASTHDRATCACAHD